MELILCNLSPLSVVMKHVTPHIVSFKCNLQFFEGIAQFSVQARVNLLQIPYLVPTQFQESIFSPLPRPKVLPHRRCAQLIDKSHCRLYIVKYSLHTRIYLPTNVHCSVYTSIKYLPPSHLLCIFDVQSYRDSEKN
jgi:hypothetical protein